MEKRLARFGIAILTLLSRSLDAPSQDLKDAEPTPRASHDAWLTNNLYTPGVMDPNHPGFSMFGHHNVMASYYTPTPGGSTTLYHNTAGDLHTPGFGLGGLTPLSMPTSEGALNAGHQAAAFHGFQSHNPHTMHPHPIPNLNPFQMHQQTSFPPHQFTHQPSFDQMEAGIGESPVDDLNMDLNLHHHHLHPHQQQQQQQQQQQHAPQMLFHSQTLHTAMQPATVHPSGEK
jgi:hypothetical protein